MIIEPPNLLYIPYFCPTVAVLFEWALSSVDWDESMQARKTASFGVPYNYGKVVCPEVPMPEPFSPLIESLTAQLGYKPNNCLANYYPDGRSSIGFHRDDMENLVRGTGVAIVSLGAARTLYFRRANQRSHRVGFTLASGSLLLMPPQVQDDWQHGIPGDATVLEPRISLTFRKVVSHGIDV
jgi:alkylated DNA repair dioxygenase AlkB